MGGGGGSDGRAAAASTRGPQLESHQNMNTNLLILIFKVHYKQ